MSEIDAFVDRISDRVGAIIRSGRGEAQDISLFPVSRRAGRTILKAETPGSSFCVKAFDIEDEAGRRRFDRELVTLQAAGASGLTPEMLGHDTDHAFLVMAWVDGPTLRTRLEGGLSRNSGVAIGNWFAEFSSLMPRSEAPGSWYTYLSGYREFGAGAALRDSRAMLDAIPLGDVGIAKNDGHLDNFLVTSERFVGIDFAEARLKPLGWDVLLTARSLRRDFGDAVKPVIDGVVKGWCDASDGFEEAEFGELVRFFLSGLDSHSETLRGSGT